jgi:hypothetical protein
VQCRLGGKIATHPMDPSAGRCRGRTEVQPLDRCGVEVEGRPDEELPEILDASINIPPDQVGIVALEVTGGENVSRQHAGAEAGGEALNLGFDPLDHVGA